MYSLTSVSKDRWLYISGNDSFDVPDEFIVFVKEYSLQFNGKIIAVSDDTQYTISNDPLKLVFQWDSCFGITVIVPTETDLMAAEKTLHDFCNTLNNKKS